MSPRVRSLVALVLILALVACALPTPPVTPPPTVTPTPSPTVELTPPPSPTALPPSPLRTPTSPVPTPPLPAVRVDTGVNLVQLPPRAPFILHFTHPMAPIDEPLRITPPTEGTAYWDDSGTLLVFVPQAGFPPGEAVDIALAPELTTAEGASLPEAYRWTAQVVPAPRVANYRIYDDTKPVYDFSNLNVRHPTVRLHFSRAMELDSVVDALDIEPPVSLDVSWDDDDALIRFEQPLAPGTSYVLTLGEDAHDVAGTSLDRDYRWTFKTQPLLRTAVTPDADDTDAHLTLHFNYALDTELAEAQLRLTPSVPGNFEWSANARTVTFVPEAPLPPYTEFRLSFAGPLTDANGEGLAPPEPLHFITPPPIVARRPTGRSVHPATPVRITFDRPMDEVATAAAVHLTPDISGTVQWDETTLTFLPRGGALAPETRYTVTVGTDTRGANGDRLLPRPYTWTFTTKELTPIANFGSGPNAQVLDADGRRALQFAMVDVRGAAERELTQITFELHALSLPQFLDRYASGFRGVAGTEMRPISIEGTTPITRWTKPITLTVDNGYHVPLVHEVRVPEGVPPGLYVLTMDTGFVNDQLILVLTRNAIMVKQAEGQIVAWVTDIANTTAMTDTVGVDAQPRAGVEVGVYARDGTRLRQGRTNADGVFRTQVARDPAPLIVVARQGDDVTVSGLSTEWRSRDTRWWPWWRPAPQAQRYAAYIYTDRPIYKPGQTVHFKAIVRRDDDAVLRLLPGDTPVTVRIRDARDNVVRTFEMTPNDLGTVHGAFDLAEGAMLGDYAVEVAIEDEAHRQTFQVEDYRKPDYNVTVALDDQRVAQGERVEVTVESAYFFGEPVPDADVEVRLFRLLPSYWWEPESGDDYHWIEEDGTLARGETDAEGRFTFTLPTASVEFAGRPVHWRGSLERATWGIEATVDDGSRQTVSSFAILEVYNAREQVWVDTHGYLHRPGEPFAVSVVVQDVLDQVPVSGRTLDLSLRRWDTGGYDLVIQSAELTTDEDGHAEVDLTIDEPGAYQMRIAGEDADGNPLHTFTYIYAFSNLDDRWYGRSSALEIEADRATYAPGDTARLLITSAFDGPALLTLERGTTRREQLVNLTAPATLVEVPIRPDDAPNIFATVHLWQEQDTELGRHEMYYSQSDSRLLVASTELRVPSTDTSLHIEITPDRASYAPRDTVTFTLRVTDHLSQPVAAEVSLALVDEAIFALSEELGPTIHEAFYHPREHIVRTYDALALQRYLAYPNGRGGGGGDGDLGGDPRSDFPDTAAWLPVLRTDANGELVVALTLPDSLTRWRLTAKAVTADTRVGAAHIGVVTQQQVVVRPILPRTLTAGDEVTLSALVHNYAQISQTLHISLTARPSNTLVLAAAPPHTLTLSSGERGIVGWTATAAGAGTAEVVVQAAVDGVIGDAVLLPLEVRPLAVPEVDTQVGRFEDTLTTTVVMPPEALAMSTLRLELSRSIAGTLLEGLAYLTGYPYGCVEQTMSRALPNAVVGRALNRLGVADPTLQADLPDKINASLQQLYGYQHNDGGWGWWYDDSTDPYQTAWVVFGLATTAEAGYEVDPDVIQQGVDWLDAHLEGMDPRTRAYALYSLAVAGSPNVTATLALVDAEADLDTFSRAGLALALHASGEDTAANAVVDELVAAAVTGPGVAYWSGDAYEGHYYDKTMASDTRNTAQALDALVRIRPDDPLIPDVVRWLMAQRWQHGWGSTNETAHAIIALTDHLLATSFSEAAASTAYTVELNGAVLVEGTLGRGEPAVTLELPASALRQGENALRLVKEGGVRQLYYVVSRRVYRAQEAIASSGTVKVTRTYLDAKTSNPVDQVAPGDLVKVELHVTMPEDAAYIIVEDPLPGGLEGLNTRLNTTQHIEDVYHVPRFYWQEYGYNHKEVHGDHVSFFVTDFPQGARTFIYYARAVHAGSFNVLPTEVTGMYDRTVWGRTASHTVVVEE